MCHRVNLEVEIILEPTKLFFFYLWTDEKRKEKNHLLIFEKGLGMAGKELRHSEIPKSKGNRKHRIENITTFRICTIMAF